MTLPIITTLLVVLLYVVAGASSRFIFARNSINCRSWAAYATIPACEPLANARLQLWKNPLIIAFSTSSDSASPWVHFFNNSSISV